MIALVIGSLVLNSCDEDYAPEPCPSFDKEPSLWLTAGDKPIQIVAINDENRRDTFSSGANNIVRVPIDLNGTRMEYIVIDTTNKGYFALDYEIGTGGCTGDRSLAYQTFSIDTSASFLSIYAKERVRPFGEVRLDSSQDLRRILSTTAYRELYLLRLRL